MKRTSVVWLALIQFVLGYEWLHAGWGKWAASGFMENLPATLAGFASKTPHAWYAGLLSHSLPQAGMLGNLIRSGEILVGVALVLAGVLLLIVKRLPRPLPWILAVACACGALMNVNFYLAAGWSSPSTAGINLVMGALHLVLAAFYVSERRALSS